MNDMIKEKWMQKYKEQEERIKALLLEDEMAVQCLDEKSFCGKYYNPIWVATSKGRVYSLYTKNFLHIKPKEVGYRTKEGKYCGMPYYYIGGKMIAHGLTANYFCDKKVIEKYGEENVQVHHKKRFDVKKGLCKNNHAGNLCYAPKKIHDGIIHPIYEGKIKMDVKSDMEFMVANMGCHSDVSVGYSVSEEQTDVLSMRFVIHDNFLSDEQKLLFDKNKLY